jgi:hypothetical protein
MYFGGNGVLKFCGQFAQYMDLTSLSGLQSAPSPLFAFAFSAWLGFGALLALRFVLAGVHVLLALAGCGLVSLCVHSR